MAESIFQTYVEVNADSTPLDKAWDRIEKKSASSARKVTKLTNDELDKIKQAWDKGIIVRFKDSIAKKTISELRELQKKLKHDFEREIQLNMDLKSVSIAKEKLDIVEKELRKIPQVAEETNIKTEKSFLKSFAKIGIAFIALRKLFNFSKEATKLASDAQGVRVAFDKLGDPHLLDKLREATRGTVSDLDLMERAVKASNFNISMKALVTGFEFATSRGIQTGETVDYLTESFVNGLGRKSTRVLDNLEISLVEIQKEVNKTGDFNVAVANIIERNMTKAGKVLDTNKTIIERTNAQLKNQQILVGEELANDYGILLVLINKLANSTGKLNTGMDALTGTIKVLATALVVVTALIKTLGTVAGTALAQVINFVSQSGKAFGKLLSGDFKGAVTELFDLKGAANIFKGGLDIIESDWGSMTKSLDDLWDKTKKNIESNPIKPKTGGTGDAALSKDQANAFEKLKFLSSQYYDLRIKQIQDEAKELEKLTGDSVAAKQYEIEQKKKLDAEYFKFKLDKYKEDEIARRASGVSIDPRSQNIKPKLDTQVRNTKPIISKEDNPGLIFVNESLKSIDKLHKKMIDNISDFGNALANAFDRSGDSFISKLNQGLQIAINIANAIGNFSKDKAAGESGSGSFLGVLGSILSIATLFKEGGSQSNKNIMPYLRIPKFASGANFTVPQGFPKDNFLMGVQSGEDVKVTPSNRAGETDRLLGILIGKVDAVNNTLFNKDLSVNIENKAPDVNTTVIRNKKTERKLNKAGKNLNER